MAENVTESIEVAEDVQIIDVLEGVQPIKVYAGKEDEESDEDEEIDEDEESDDGEENEEDEGNEEDEQRVGVVYKSEDLEAEIRGRVLVVHGIPTETNLGDMSDELEAENPTWGNIEEMRWLLGNERRWKKRVSPVVVYLERQEVVPREAFYGGNRYVTSLYRPDWLGGPM